MTWKAYFFAFLFHYRPLISITWPVRLHSCYRPWCPLNCKHDKVIFFKVCPQLFFFLSLSRLNKKERKVREEKLMQTGSWMSLFSTISITLCHIFLSQYRLTQLLLSNTKLTDDGMKSLAGKIFVSYIYAQSLEVSQIRTKYYGLP